MGHGTMGFSRGDPGGSTAGRAGGALGRCRVPGSQPKPSTQVEISYMPGRMDLEIEMITIYRK